MAIKGRTIPVKLSVETFEGLSAMSRNMSTTLEALASRILNSTGELLYEAYQLAQPGDTLLVTERYEATKSFRSLPDEHSPKHSCPEPSYTLLKLTHGSATAIYYLCHCGKLWDTPYADQNELTEVECNLCNRAGQTNGYPCLRCEGTGMMTANQAILNREAVP